MIYQAKEKSVYRRVPSFPRQLRHKATFTHTEIHSLTYTTNVEKHKFTWETQHAITTQQCVANYNIFSCCVYINMSWREQTFEYKVLRADTEIGQNIQVVFNKYIIRALM